MNKPILRECLTPISILMPVRNEAHIILKVVNEWLAEVLNHLPQGSELVFEDGASTDGTYELLLEISRKNPQIRILRSETCDGFGKSARRLYLAARNEVLFFTDSDGQYVASDFWKLVPYLSQYRFIRGGKISRQDPLFRKLSSAIFNWIVRVQFDIYYSDINCAFHLIQKSLIRDFLPRLNCLPTLLHTELVIRLALDNIPIKQIYITHRARASGMSRGLPPSNFLSEVIKAIRGLIKLKAEYMEPPLKT